jgi:hypothetical protein
MSTQTLELSHTLGWHARQRLACSTDTRSAGTVRLDAKAALFIKDADIAGCGLQFGVMYLELLLPF